MSGKKDADYCAYRAVQVAPLSAGDLIVWDSRVVHCSAGFDAKADPFFIIGFVEHRAHVRTEQPPLARAQRTSRARAAKDARNCLIRPARSGAICGPANGYEYFGQRPLVPRRGDAAPGRGTPSGYQAPDAGSCGVCPRPEVESAAKLHASGREE